MSDRRFIIRPARTEDAQRLQDIELATLGQFVAIGYDHVAADPPDSIELLVEYARSERSWVTVVDDQVVGNILVGVLDDAAHIFHVCVDPDYQGYGLGKGLIEQVKSWAHSTDVLHTLSYTAPLEVRRRRSSGAPKVTASSFPLGSAAVSSTYVTAPVADRHNRDR